ncbi:hypothetical protein DFO70_106246 [Cytobacillus firmus]|uniref:Uncharacterized protein n=2 Tax=Cytobacillus TaxID=2675230 RepID=A0A366JV63_CYTFI|nr:hypothetical protein [Cytobacillus firmus]RBP93114.1 hypothetical protein DFO70_106246 [Cytobacillus firmus]TDX42716.1 hypothetical protein DFO72_106246 [Cytobacillus oceanisediminis]
MEKDDEVFTRYHNDFSLCNAKLSEHYGPVKFERNDRNLPDLDEISSEQVNLFLPFVLNDFEYDKKDAEKPLEVFTFQQIVGYVETSVELGIAELKKLSHLKN